MSFVARLKAPSKSDAHYYSNSNPLYAAGYGMPNCTAYAWGRFYELMDLSSYGSPKGKLPVSNAGGWFDKCTAYEKGQVAKLGAIAVWRKNGSTNNGGHVAVVEEIREDGTIKCSNSGYQSTNFYLTTIKIPYKVNNYTFQGFIYLPFNYEQEKEETVVENHIVIEAVENEEIKVGDYVIVNGIGTADSYGSGAKTGTYKEKRMQVMKIVDLKRSHPYALNKNCDGKGVTAWFKKEDIRKG